MAALTAAGVPYVGAGRISRPAFGLRCSKRVGSGPAFIGLSCTMADPGGVEPVRDRADSDPYALSGGSCAAAGTPGVSSYVETAPMPGDTERAFGAVSEAKRGADFVIVGIHWGVPIGGVAANQDELAIYQQRPGRALVDAGADANIGHHSHVLHGIEGYRRCPNH